MKGSGLGLLGFSLLLVCGCGTTVTYTPTNSPPRPLKPKFSPQEVQVFTSTAPTRPVVEVGILRAQQASEYSVHDEPQIIAELRRKASMIGCDAITILGKDDKVTGATATSSSTLAVHQVEGFQANCLVFTGPEPPAASEPAAAPAQPDQKAKSAPAAPRDRSAGAKGDEVRALLSQGQGERAESLALGTINACADGCSGPVLARLWALVGVARSRRNDRAAAAEAFRKALAADPGVTLDDAVTDDKARAIFFEARSAP